MHYSNPDYLLKNWLEGDGIPESSAYAIAQTPDQYLWVGTAGGVLRFNGYEFAPTGAGPANQVLNGLVECLYVDHSGQLWASSDAGVAHRASSGWKTIYATNTLARSMAEDISGLMLLGTYDGRLFSIRSDRILPFPAPQGLVPSGVFCLSDVRDGGIWLANRGFVGRLTPHGWVRFNPPGIIHNSLVAATARNGGIWTYTPGTLTSYSADGRTTVYSAPDIEQPRALLEDRSGDLWVASSTRGYIRFAPGGPVVATVNDTNGLVQNSAWYLMQDSEGDFWLGGSSGGLTELRPKVFKTFGVENGLPCQIVRTIAEETPGTIIAGTHGRGIVRIRDGKVSAEWSVKGDRREDYVWSILHDTAGRNWIGTYEGGLFVEEQGVTRSVDLPPSLGKTVNCVYQDSRGLIWIGTGSGVGIIENDVPRNWGERTALSGTGVRNIVEDPRTGALWFGTYDHGIYRLDHEKLTHFGRTNGLPGNRICSLYVDHDGCLWAGVFGHDLVCIRGNRVSLVNHDPHVPIFTAGSIIEDDLGWIWCDTDHGLMRVSADQLHQATVRSGPQPEMVFFDSSDGLVSADCSEGFQPAVTRDHSGKLWFATVGGIVCVDPSDVCLNTNPPPVVIERIVYRDPTGTYRSLVSTGADPVSLAPGSGDLTITLAALSFVEPEKNRYSYFIDGFSKGWEFVGSHRTVPLPDLPPGHYRLQVRAANNDGAWNDAGAVAAFSIRPYFWQTWWFRVFLFLAVAVVASLVAWQVTLARLRRHIQDLEQQRALERERARLATVMEATSDLVAFADNTGKILHLNPAGRKLLGLEPAGDLAGLTLVKMLPRWAAQVVAEEGIPAARQQGSWEAETALLHRSGREIPVIQTIMVHQGPNNGDSFLSTIVRDISEQKRHEQASERLQAQLLQAQKMESVGRLAGGIAHDFNNMLQVILGNADLALEESQSGSQLHLELLEIRKSAARSAELTSQLLTFARKQVFRPQELNLKETVEGTSKMLQRLIGETIDLSLRLGPDVWPVRMDPSQVTQILTNLAINARDAINGQGRLVIEVSNVVLSSTQAVADAEVVPGEFVLLSVSDNGQGMTREVLDHLFEPFFTTKDIGKGTGLGLATVFGIVKQNQGFIRVDSTPGQGSTFRIYLPRSAYNTMNSIPSPQKPRPTRGTETVLIVEDEENILHLVVLTLRKQGYQVIPALTPEAALNMAAAHNGPIHLLVTDIVMPGMNGRELKEKLAATQPRMKSLFMSGYTADVIAQHGALEPGIHFLQKPFTIQSFLEKVRQILDAP